MKVYVCLSLKQSLLDEMGVSMSAVTRQNLVTFPFSKMSKVEFMN